MARRVTDKVSAEHVRSNCYLVCVSFIVILLQSSAFARPAPVELENGGGRDNGGADNSLGINDSSFFGSTWMGIVVSVGFLVILASFLALCGAGGCCGKIQWFGRGRQDVPLSFSNPMTETEPGSTMMVPISQIDVRALEVDPIVFEPLPTVHDLTPLSNKVQSDRGHSSSRNHVIPIVPFSIDDSSIYAHDWFEEPHNNFPRTNIEYVKEIGKGWFGQVIEAEARDIVPFARKIRVIVKVLREDANGIEQMRFLDESRMYRDANHGNILKLLGHSIEKLPFLLIMEYCPQGDLKSFLISNVTRAEMLNSQGTIIRMALDVAKGLEWLHNAGFVHPDLAARNCQVGSENRVVIGDYGMGTQNFKDDYHWGSSIAIPLRWTAPETLHCTTNLIQILKVTESSNVWAFGVLVWEICEFGKLPYFELADDDVIARVIIDKNYFLGRPTLPCMSAKEELYKIMSSCWQSEIENRPSISSIVLKLENLQNCNASPPRDEFESKWEQLGSRSNSEDEKRRKKNVSFVGLENHIKPFDLNSSMEENETIRNADSSSVAGHLSLLNNCVLEHSSDFMDPEEEQLWTQKLERGDIAQKVLEKSQSVQDLMVLTHIEKSDFGDLDSLVYVPKTTQSSVVDGKENDSANSTLRKSSSETAIDSLSFSNSSHTLTPSSMGDSSSQNSTLVPPEFSVTPVTPGATPNRSGININIISATPNPPVDINIIEATPNKGSPPNDSESKEKDNSSKTNNINRKLHFRFGSDSSPVKSGRQRQTSTPLRSGSTPSPRISDFDDKEEEDEDVPVFESSAHYMEGTFSLSPISQHHVSSSTFNSTKMEESSKEESSVVFGASDDHELGSYQGVKSQLFESSEGLKDAESEEDECLEKTVLNEQKLLNRRVLFPNGVDSNEKEKETNSTTEYPYSFTHNDNDSRNRSKVEDSANGSAKAGKEEFDGDEFWEQQLKSLQVAAGNTRQLFQRGLNDPEDAPDENNTEDKRFVEDIEAASEELGSLVLHDLEEPDSTQTVIKETREAIGPDAGVSAKLAFERNTVKSTPLDESTVSSNMTCDSEVTSDSVWDINNSIEIRKGKEGEKRPTSTTVAETESDTEDIEEAVSKEFIPSKWNQSLLPSRPAIKSPEQQLRSGMKKSVSFENKKTQLVYEYPPPPVVSDSEEEERLITPLTSASLSLPLSSSLDWELTQEELEDAEINHEDWDDDVLPKPGDPMDVYRISGFSDDNFQVRGSSEPFVFSPSTLGELRHTRDRLRLDLSRGEANFLDEESNKSNPAKLDSGVGSSTNVSPFNNCDILTKRNQNSE